MSDSIMSGVNDRVVRFLIRADNFDPVIDLFEDLEDPEVTVKYTENVDKEPFDIEDINRLTRIVRKHGSSAHARRMLMSFGGAVSVKEHGELIKKVLESALQSAILLGDACRDENGISLKYSQIEELRAKVSNSLDPADVRKA